MIRPLLAVLAIALPIAGCGSSSSSSSSSSGPSSPPPTGAHTVIQAKMSGYAFDPSTIHARVGESIHWVNDDSAPHNVTGTSGPTFKASPTFSRGGSFTLRLTQAGTYHYFCTVHPFMKGTIEVTG
jgi:plastocyanin